MVNAYSSRSEAGPHCWPFIYPFLKTPISTLKQKGLLTQALQARPQARKPAAKATSATTETEYALSNHNSRCLVTWRPFKVMHEMHYSLLYCMTTNNVCSFSGLQHPFFPKPLQSQGLNRQWGPNPPQQLLWLLPPTRIPEAIFQKQNPASWSA